MVAWGLGRKAAAGAIAASSLAGGQPVTLEYESGYGPDSGGPVYGYSYTMYDSEGRVIYEFRSDGQTFHYDYARE